MKINLSLVLLKILIMFQYINLLGDIFPNYFQVILFTLFILSLLKNKNIMSKGIKISIFSIVIFIVVLIRCIIANQLNMGYYSPFQSAIARYQFMAYPFIYCYVINLDKKEKRALFNLALFSIITTVLISFYYLIFVDPQAVRNTQGVNYVGVGDFQLMYAIATLIGPLVLLMFKCKKDKKLFSILMVSTLIFVICLLMCNLVTTWIIMILSIFIIIYISHKGRYKHIVLSFFFLLIVMSRNLISNTLYKIANSNIFYWSTNNKIIAIANVIMGNFNNIDTLSRRTMLINQSLNSFKQHPFLGIDFKEHIRGNVGCHSQWADDLARFGIFGNIFILFNYIYVAKYTIKNSINKITKMCIKCAWITFFILGFLNPCLSGTILMVIFVIIPTFDSMIEGE